MANPTVLDIRQRFADRIGPFYASTATGGTVSTLLEARSPILSTIRSTRDLDGYYLMRPAAATNDKYRRVASYVPTTGTITPDNTYGVAPVNTEAYELHGIIDPSKMNTLINRALTRVPVMARRNYTWVLGNQVFSMQANAALPVGFGREDVIYQIGWTPAGSVSDPSWNPWEHLVSFEILNVQFNPGYAGPDIIFSQKFNDGDILSFLFQTTANHYINATYSSGTTDVTLDADVVVADLDLIVASCLVQAWKDYSFELEPEAAQGLIPRVQDAQAEFNRLVIETFQPPPIARAIRVRPWGPTWRQ